MTTSVMIASPYNALHGLSVQVEERENGVWTPKGEPIIVNPRETADTLHISDDERVVIVVAGAKVQPL